MKDTHSTHLEVDSGDHHTELNPVKADTSLMIITWVSFFVVLAILHKFAWKPILEALERREKTLKDSLEEAEKLRVEFERIEQTRQEILDKTDVEAKEIIEKSRQAAQEAAKHIQQKAKEENLILVENAKREIKNELDKARNIIKEDSIEVAVHLAEKLIDKNMDDRKNKRLIDEFIKEN